MRQGEGEGEGEGEGSGSPSPTAARESTSVFFRGMAVRATSWHMTTATDRAVTRVFEVIRALIKTISQGAHTRPKHESNHLRYTH